jgi:penicillin-binding protein 2
MYDRTGIPLVRNLPMFAASVTPADLPKAAAARSGVISRLSAIVGVAPADIEAKIKEFAKFPTTPVTVAQDLTHDQAVLLSVSETGMPGAALESVARREYLQPAEARSLSHVLGYEGRITEQDLTDPAFKDYAPADLSGKTGLEKQYEKVLRGQVGRRRVEVDALGRQKSVIAEEKGDAGKNLVLSIDLDLQKTAEKALNDEMRATGKKRGSVIVTNPNTGEVLALVSEPSFDDNLFSRGISQADYSRLNDDPDHPLFPRAIAASLPSGSVFKPIMAAAAIDEHIVSTDTAFLSTGGLHLGQAFFPDWKAGGHGLTNLAKAIAESVNTYFYIIGGGWQGQAGLGVKRITEYARKFGLGAPTGIDLPGEGAGFLPSEEWKLRVKGERWYLGDTYHLAIGQGDLLVTPLQINVMTMAVANGGTLMKPHLVNAVTATDGTRSDMAPVVVARQIVSPAAISAVQAGMRQTVTAGSARSLQSLPVHASAKTGTAQWNSIKPNHAWFTSYAPSEKPEIVVTVMIEEGVEGSSTAAPVAKAILQHYFDAKK